MNIHIFNPEHDLALAADNVFWTAPHAGRQLRADLGWLPLLWAEEGDVVVVDDVTAAENVYRKMKNATRDIRFVTLSDLNQLSIDNVEVWGWDKSIVHQLERYGVERSLMPSPEMLDAQRAFSDRATGARLLQALREVFPSATIGNAIVAKTVDEVVSLHHEQGSIVLKAPWSSSGRGVQYLIDDSENTMKWVAKVIRTQGHIMVEPYLNKVKDFGMEFTVLADGSIRYEGLSLFHTANNAYEGSILATEKEKRGLLAHYTDLELLSDVQQFIQKWLKKNLNGCYIGPLGIDMMLVHPTLPSNDGKMSESSSILLQPCIEINLRRTMGHVALSVSPKDDGNQQIMRIAYEGKNYHFRVYNDHELYF